MPNRLIDLRITLPVEVMLIIEHPSGVNYWNQAGGNMCAQPETEGVLAPLGLSDAENEQLMTLPYGYGRGLAVELADRIDAVLAGSFAARLSVDRDRRGNSMESWVFVTGELPEYNGLDGPSAVYGFGQIKGVLTWPNSD